MDDEITIKIKMTSNAQVYTLKVNKSDTIEVLKEKCSKETSVPAQSQNLVYKGRILSNEKLVSDYNIDNDHTIILVKKHIPSQTSTTENKPSTQTTSTSNTNTNTNNYSNNSNNNNSNNNNYNPFMGLGGQMPDLSQLGSLMGNIDPNSLNDMMQNLGNGGGLGNMGMGMNPQMMGQLLSNPMYMQMMQNMLQNPQMLQMAINSPQMRQLAQNNPQMQALLNNPQLLQQILNPQTLQMMSNMFQSMGGGNNNPNNNNNNTNNNNGQRPAFDFSQMANLFSGMGGLFGNQNNNSGSGFGAGENFSNIGINDNNDPNVDYKEKYKDQLAQMKEMGFVNEETNIQMLKQCNGNVQFAIERMLNMLG